MRKECPSSNQAHFVDGRSFFDASSTKMRHFVDDKLLIEAMTPNRSLSLRRCVSREMRSRVQGDVCRRSAIEGVG